MSDFQSNPYETGKWALQDTRPIRKVYEEREKYAMALGDSRAERLSLCAAAALAWGNPRLYALVRKLAVLEYAMAMPAGKDTPHAE